MDIPTTKAKIYIKQLHHLDFFFYHLSSFMSLFKKMETTTPHQATLYHRCVYTNNPHEPIYAYMTFYEPPFFYLFYYIE